MAGVAVSTNIKRWIGGSFVRPDRVLEQVIHHVACRGIMACKSTQEEYTTDTHVVLNKDVMPRVSSRIAEIVYPQAPNHPKYPRLNESPGSQLTVVSKMDGKEQERTGWMKISLHEMWMVLDDMLSMTWARELLCKRVYGVYDVVHDSNDICPFAICQESKDALCKRWQIPARMMIMHADLIVLPVSSGVSVDAANRRLSRLSGGEGFEGL